MKILDQRTFLLLWAIIVSITVTTAQNVISGEWFIGNDPGFGQGNALSITPDGEVFVSDQLSATLTPGTHLVHFRVKDDQGSWSHTQYRYFHMRGSMAVTELVSGEWFMGEDPGFGAGTSFTFDPASEVTGLPVTGSAGGTGDPLRTVSIRTKDELGHWSHTQTRALFVRPHAGGDIVHAEWFMGEDPGFGAGNAIDVGSAAPVIEAMIAQAITTGLEEGEHFLQVRAINNLGTPSLTYVIPFTIAIGTGLGDQQAHGISIGPNPTRDEIIIRSEKALIGTEFQLRDASGKLLRAEKFNGTLRIEMNAHAPGTYFLFLIDAEGSRTVFPIVKQ